MELTPRHHLAGLVLPAGLLLVGMMLAGCHHAASWSDPADRLIHRGGPDRPASLVFEPESLTAARAAANAPQAGEQGAGQLAWYDYRNDARLTTQAGYQGATYEAEATYTYDRQSQYNGHVYDHYSQTTRRYRTSDTVRY